VEVLTPPGLYGGGQPAATIETRAAEANVYNSPGWKRMQARQGQYGMSQPKESRNTVIDATAIASFTLGERVFHQKFGYGAVTGIEGDKVEVDFDKAGVKKVVSRFLTAKDDVPF
jgi:DNA helicase-2/ATP-dependent DNA helicase PcrA